MRSRGPPPTCPQRHDRFFARVLIACYLSFLDAVDADSDDDASEDVYHCDRDRLDITFQSARLCASSGVHTCVHMVGSTC